MKDYHINIFYSEEDEVYIADIPDLKYCSAIANTPQATSTYRSNSCQNRMARSRKCREQNNSKTTLSPRNLSNRCIIQNKFRRKNINTAKLRM